MKAKFLILTALALFITMNMKAQRNIAITLYEGTDSAMVIMASNEIVIVSTKDSTAILRRDMVDIEGFPQKKQSRRKSKYYELQKLESFFGRITQWHHNDNFIYDGFYLQTENETFLVEFNSTLAIRLKALDENVEVNGMITKYTDNENRVIRMISVHDRKDTIYSNMYFVFYSLKSDSGKIINRSGKIDQIQYAKNGNIVGCVLENNIVLDFNKHAEKQLSKELKVGLTVKYTGKEQYLREGQIMNGDYTIINCHTISINETNYIIYRTDYTKKKKKG